MESSTSGEDAAALAVSDIGSILLPSTSALVNPCFSGTVAGEEEIRFFFSSGLDAV